MSDPDRSISYTALAGQTVFSVPWTVRDDAHLQIYLNGSLLAPSAYVYSSSGLDITLNAASAANDVVLVHSVIGGNRNMVFSPNSQIPSGDLNEEFNQRADDDRELRRDLGRAVMAPPGQIPFNLPYGDDATNKILVGVSAFALALVSAANLGLGVISDTPGENSATDAASARRVGLLETTMLTKLDASAYTAEDILAKLITVDGPSSGTNADKLDDQHGPYYLDYNNFTNKPTIPPVAPVSSVAGRTGAVVVTKADVGLGNADNTSDADKPISTATQGEIDKRVINVLNLAALRDVTDTAVTSVDVSDRITYGDGGGGKFTTDNTTGHLAGEDDGGINVVGSDGRLWIRQFRGDVHVHFFGADPTGVVPCDTAAQAAWDYVVSKNGGTIKFGVGDYLFSTGITSTANIGNPQSNGITVKGQGKAQTTFINNTLNPLLFWEQTTSRNVRFHAHSFGVRMSLAGNNGTIINIKHLEGGLGRQRMVVIEKIDIFPDDITTNYVDKGIVIEGVYFPLVRDVTIANPYGPGIAKSVTHQGTVGIDFLDCYGPEAYNCKVWAGAFGFRHVVTVNPGGEGGRFELCTSDSNTSFYVSSLGDEPVFVFRECHANFVSQGIYVHNRRLVKIEKSVFFNETTSGAAHDIVLNDCQYVQIDDMDYFFAGNADRKNVVITGTTKKVQITDNRHYSNGYGYDIAATCDQIDIDDIWVDPDIASLGGWTHRSILDAGATNVTVSYKKKQRVRAITPDGVNLATGVAGNITWTAEDGDVGGWFAPSGTGFVVPAYSGITKVRLTCNVNWGNNSTGVREIYFTVNGAQVAGGGRNLSPAAGLTAMNMSSGELTVAAGDVIRLVGFQDSGAGQAIRNDANSWFELEAV